MGGGGGREAGWLGGRRGWEGSRVDWWGEGVQVLNHRKASTEKV